MTAGRTNWSSPRGRTRRELDEPRPRSPPPPDRREQRHEDGRDERRDGQAEDRDAAGEEVQQRRPGGRRRRRRRECRSGSPRPAPCRPARPSRAGAVPARRARAAGSTGTRRDARVRPRRSHSTYCTWIGRFKPELRTQILEVLAVGLLLQHELDDVAGDQAGQREDDERGDEQRRDRRPAVGGARSCAWRRPTPIDPLGTPPTCRSRPPSAARRSRSRCSACSS